MVTKQTFVVRSQPTRVDEWESRLALPLSTKRGVGCARESAAENVGADINMCSVCLGVAPQERGRASKRNPLRLGRLR